jgi:lipopolysaccharide export system protein LptC
VSFSIAALLLPASGFAQITAPARNWVLPVFSKEGFRSMTARGTEARATEDRRFHVVDLHLTFFKGGASNEVDSIILSPAATFVPEEKTAHGENHVRLVRDDLEAAGIRWTYRQADKRISLDGNVRVTFRAEIKDLLR